MRRTRSTRLCWDRVPWTRSARQIGICTEKLVGAIRGAGRDCYVWTVNEPAQVDRLVGWGVSGIITDRPGALRARLGR